MKEDTARRQLRRRTLLAGSAATLTAGLSTAAATADDDTQQAPPIDDRKVTEQYAPQLVNAPAVWQQGIGVGSRSEVTIGIVDDGVDFEHEALAAQLGDDPGANFAADEQETPLPQSPRQFHGTTVAGVAAGRTGDQTGIAGISNAQLVAARVVRSGSTDATAITQGIEYLLDRDVDIIVLPLLIGDSETASVSDALAAAETAGTLVVAGSGAGFGGMTDCENLLITSSIDANERFATLREYADSVDLTAPGEALLSTLPDDRYGRIKGTTLEMPGYSRYTPTSFAPGTVAGVAALALEVDLTLTPDELSALLQETARDVGLPEAQQGSGCVDAQALIAQLHSDDQQTEDLPANTSGDTRASTTANLEWLFDGL